MIYNIFSTRKSIKKDQKPYKKYLIREKSMDTYQNLINSYLMECAVEHLESKAKWG